MKKPLSFSLLAALSLLLCAFAAAPASQDKPKMTVEMTTVIASDGSGSLEYKITLSKELMDEAREQNADFEETEICDTLFEYGPKDWDQSESSIGGALSCMLKNKFEDLDELESEMESEFRGASFERLEIKDGTLYYDLVPNISGSLMVTGGGEDFDFEAWWVLEVPGKVVSSNADKTSGQTLKWDMLELSYSDHVKFECKTGGGGFLGLDPTLTIVAVIGLMGCCCVIVLIIGVAVFFLLRRKKAAAPAA